MFTSYALMAAPVALQAAADGTTTSVAPDVARYLMACTAVLGLLALALIGLRHLARKSGRRGGGQRLLEVTDALSMGGSKRLCVVRCGERRFLIGVGDKELASIAELSDDEGLEVVPQAPPVDEPKQANNAVFKSALERAASRPVNELAPQSAANDETVEARRKVAEELLARMEKQGWPPQSQSLSSKSEAPSVEEPKTVERLLREEGWVG